MATRPPPLAHPPRARADRPVGRAPAEHQQVRVGVAVDLEVGHLDAGHLRRAQLGHARVVGAVVGDRARAVELLQPADPVRAARACRGSPTAAPGCRRARRGGTACPRGGVVRKRGSIARQVGRRRDLPRLARVGDEQVAQQDHRRAVGDRDPHRLVDGLEALPGRRTPRPPAAATRRGARTAPAAGPTARSWSACRSTGPARWTSMITIGSSSITARPIVSVFRSRPGPRRARHAQRAAERRAQRHRRGRDLVLGLDRPHAQVLPARRARAAGPTRA